MNSRGKHPDDGRSQSSDTHRHSIRPSPRAGQHQHHNQYGHPWPPEQHRQHHQHHHPQQNPNRQHQPHQHPGQRQDEPSLYKTGGRPWTMYKRDTPRSESGRSPAGRDTPDGEAAGCDRTAGKGRGGGGGGGRGKGKGAEFTVVSYNVLADSLVSFDYIPYCKTWNEAAWRARPGRILKKVLEFRPAVVCLQEVDEDLYDGVFRKQLESLGYVGTYCRRKGGKSDGCATFVLGEQVRLVDQEAVTYKVQGHPVLDRDNVALLVVVDILLPHQSQTESETPQTGGQTPSPDAEAPMPRAAAAACPQPCNPAGASSSKSPASAFEDCSTTRRRAARLVVANTHLLFNPKRGDIKAAQLMVLTGKVERLAKTSGADGVMVCGDFNMTPDSALYHYMVKGALNIDGLNRFTVSGQCGLTNRMQYDQRKETDNGGVMHCRVSGAKHQGSGCSLGSFLRPATSAASGSGGRGGRGGRWRGRRGRGNKHFRQDTAPLPRRQSCQTCSNRRPHDASCTYVVADDPTLDSVDYGRPPGAPAGTRFAVMDPLSCRCAAAGHNDGGGGGGASSGGRRPDEGITKKLKPAGGGGAGVENEFHGGRETYDPPVLWPVQGEKIAFRRNRGPVVHSLGLQSAYAQQGDAWGTGEPAFSSYHHMFKGTVDYIFYGPGPPSDTASVQEAAGRSAEDQGSTTGQEAMLLSGRGEKGLLRCVGVAEPPLRCDLDRFGGLPSPEEPSDHVLLAARFEVTIP